MRRRRFLTFAAGSVTGMAGCLGSGGDADVTPSREPTATRTRSPTDTPTETATPEPTPTHPWGRGAVTVGLQRQATGPHDLNTRIETTLDYWETNAPRYAEHSITYEYRPNARNPDIEITVVEEISNCGRHPPSTATVGCAPLIRSHPPRTADVRVRGDLDGDHLERVLKHEIGHTLGLDHRDEPQNIMSDDPEARIPDYSERTDIIDLYNGAIGSMNTGHDTYARASDAYQNEQLSRAARILNEATTAFESARENFLDAAEIAFSIEADRVVNICEDAATACYHYHHSMGYFQDACRAYDNRNYDRGDSYIESHQDHHATAQNETVRSSGVVIDELGLAR